MFKECCSPRPWDNHSNSRLDASVSKEFPRDVRPQVVAATYAPPPALAFPGPAQHQNQHPYTAPSGPASYAPPAAASYAPPSFPSASSQGPPIPTIFTPSPGPASAQAPSAQYGTVGGGQAPGSAGARFNPPAPPGSQSQPAMFVPVAQPAAGAAHQAQVRTTMRV